MSSGSPSRKWRRKKMRENKVSFTERLRESVRTATPIQNVVFTGKPEK